MQVHIVMWDSPELYQEIIGVYMTEDAAMEKCAEMEALNPDEHYWLAHEDVID